MDKYGTSYQGEKKSKFMQAVLLGAFAGAAISMFDKDTREATITGSKKCLSSMGALAKNPNSLINQVKEASGKMKTTIEKISEDVAFISQRVEDLKDVAPQVASVVKETKEAFVEDEENKEGVSLVTKY